MRRSGAVLAGAILLATAAVWWSGAGTRGRLTGDRLAADSRSSEKAAGESEASRRGRDVDAPSGATRIAPSSPRPRSLRGTQVDGALLVDGNGHLLVSPDTRRFFDYFLSASGEEPAAALRARLVAAIESQLGPPAAVEAIDLLDRYLRYRDRARDLAGTPAAEDLAARARAVSELRREVLGEADAAALFADEEARLRIALAERAVVADSTLTDDERARRLAMLADAAPDEVREARAATMLAATLRSEEAALREQGGSPEDLRALRERRVGHEAAERLAALDARRADWQGRLDEYRVARQQIEGDASLDEGGRRAALERLRAERFSKQEQVRVRALDRGWSREAAAVSVPARPPALLERPLAPGPASP